MVTDSVVGSDHEHVARFYTEDENSFFGVTVTFSDPLEYKVGWCGSTTTFSLDDESSTRVWTITKTDTTSVTMHCNGVEIFTYYFADSGFGNCVKWELDTTLISFLSSKDDASDLYRTKPRSMLLLSILLEKLSPY